MAVESFRFVFPSQTPKYGLGRLRYAMPSLDSLRHQWKSMAVWNLLRIAGIQTIFADEDAPHVTLEAMSNGIGMMEWYLSEMLRISDTGRPNEELCAAEELRSWICKKWHEDYIDKRTLMKNGPGHLRDGNTLARCTQKLEEHGWLVRETGKQVIAGANSRTFWRVVRPGTLT